MTPEAVAVAASLFALCVSIAYFLRDRAALRMEDEFCLALARANGRCDKLAADLADATARLNQANAALGLAEDEITRLNAGLDLVTAKLRALEPERKPADVQ